MRLFDLQRMTYWIQAVLAAAAIGPIAGAARADFGFYRTKPIPSDVGLPSQVVQNARAASVKLLAQWEFGASLREFLPQSGCSAQFISDDGYLLTASHCLHRLLTPNPFLPEVLSKLDLAKPKITQIADVTHQKDQLEGTSWSEFGCHAPSDLVLPDIVVFDEEGLIHRGKATVVYLGGGFFGDESHLILDEKLGIAVAPSLLGRLRSASEDFVILKVEGLRKRKCIKVAHEPVEPKMPVWNIGFPAPAPRADGKSANGESNVVSRGVVLGSLREFPDFRGYSSEAMRIIDSFYISDIAFTSDADAVSGSSGSMVLNESGQLVGIVFLGAPSGVATDRLFTRPLTTGVRATRIMEDLVSQFGARAAEAITRCAGS